MRGFVLPLLALLVLGGCGGDSTPAVTEASPTPLRAVPTPRSTPENPREPAADPALVTREQMGDAWPLTVDAVRIGCARIGDTEAPYFDADGDRYALTGFAASHGYGELLEAHHDVWADNPGVEGTKMNIAPLRQRAIALC